MIFILVMLFILTVDLIVKNFVVDMPETAFPLKKCKGKVSITRAYNEGMACNIMSKNPALVKKISTIMLAVFGCLFIPLFFIKKVKNVRKLGASMILGGAASNVIDRYTKGNVVDYIQFNTGTKGRLSKYVYNLADFSIILGTIFFAAGKRKKKKK